MATEVTLAQLAELLEMQPRTIRSYIEQGLLRGPEVGGRGARYTDYHIERLRAIRVLKDLRGLPLAEVRRRLLTMSAADIVALGGTLMGSATEPRPTRPDSALAYLRSIRSDPGETASPPPPAPPGQPAAQGPLDQMLARLDQFAGTAKPARKARAEVWTVVAVSPDVELRIRGTFDTDDRARWERVADHLRELMLSPSAPSLKEK